MGEEGEVKIDDATVEVTTTTMEPLPPKQEKSSQGTNDSSPICNDNASPTSSVVVARNHSAALQTGINAKDRGGVEYKELQLQQQLPLARTLNNGPVDLQHLPPSVSSSAIGCASAAVPNCRSILMHRHLQLLQNRGGAGLSAALLQQQQELDRQRLGVVILQQQNQLQEFCTPPCAAGPSPFLASSAVSSVVNSNSCLGHGGSPDPISRQPATGAPTLAGSQDSNEVLKGLSRLVEAADRVQAFTTKGSEGWSTKEGEDHNTTQHIDEDSSKGGRGEQGPSDCSDDGDTFPFKLYRMLMQAEEDGNDDIVSFLPDSQTFAIHKPREFVTEIMPNFFTTTRMSSFQRQLNLYNFRRITEGSFKGGYRHHHFVKGKKFLCSRIKRKKTKGKIQRDLFTTGLPNTTIRETGGAGRGHSVISDAALWGLLAHQQAESKRRWHQEMLLAARGGAGRVSVDDGFLTAVLASQQIQHQHTDVLTQKTYCNSKKPGG